MTEPTEGIPTAKVVEAPDDAQQLHGNRVATGLTPLIWGGMIVVVVLGVLVWQFA